MHQYKMDLKDTSRVHPGGSSNLDMDASARSKNWQSKGKLPKMGKMTNLVSKNLEI
jgi:hypothetical protein